MSNQQEVYRPVVSYTAYSEDIYNGKRKYLGTFSNKYDAENEANKHQGSFSKVGVIFNRN